MKAVILAGGFGTRLSEETDILPKPMIEIGGRPLLWHIMKIFSCQGVDNFVVALGYKGQVIKRYFMQYPLLASDLTVDLASGQCQAQKLSAENWRIELADTGDGTMTGGRLKRLKNRLDTTFFFTYGDGLSNVDLKKLLSFHKSHGKLATVTAVMPPHRFGVLGLNGDTVTHFAEKPMTHDNYINGGFFVLEPQALDYIEGDETSWEREPCERLAADGQLMAFKHSGYWQCVDTLHELRLLRNSWDLGKAQWKIWE
ncbi:MAG: glucose-1-phosphate cytidylyltransferase [Desulfatibacillaceae bacterium]|nr:glucose-1-phosphate cytidylyltransferase [Desulfatibacillaceae bacterium]